MGHEPWRGGHSCIGCRRPACSVQLLVHLLHSCLPLFRAAQATTACIRQRERGIHDGHVCYRHDDRREARRERRRGSSRAAQLAKVLPRIRGRRLFWHRQTVRYTSAPPLRRRANSRLSHAVGHPFDTVKVRLQTTDTSQFKGPLDCLLQTVRKEGFTGLYKGASPPLVGWMFMDSMYARRTPRLLQSAAGRCHDCTSHS
jgi:hypothetical protein